VAVVAVVVVVVVVVVVLVVVYDVCVKIITKIKGMLISP
jgi:hypothetical protein